ncbi:MAG: amidohydrolase family protein [Candidatus Cyclobacteriaceae bacterium M2_1C_046]
MQHTLLAVIIALSANYFYSHGQEKCDIQITNVNIIDGTGGSMKSDVNLYIKDGRILKISKSNNEFSADELINGKGKYVIPGLFDAHFHLENGKEKLERSLKQLIHFGVTTVLIPGGSSGTYGNVQELIEQEKQNKITSPHLLFTSLITTIEGAHPMKMYGAKYFIDSTSVYIIKNEEHIEWIAADAKENNAIALKLIVEDGPAPPFIERIPENYIKLMAEEGDKYNLPLFCHVSDMEEVKISINNGADALMHFVGVQVNWNEDRPAIEKMAKNNISWVTTGMIFKSFSYPLHKEWRQTEHWAVYGKDQLSYLNGEDGKLESESRSLLKQYFKTDTLSYETMTNMMLKDIKGVYDAGVNIVAGTDVGGRPYIMPGLSLHEELEILQLIGINPLDIIRISTRNAAQMLDQLADYGTVEKGKYADLILLNKNPLEDISNTLSINKVFKHGIEQKRY